MGNGQSYEPDDYDSRSHKQMQGRSVPPQHHPSHLYYSQQCHPQLQNQRPQQQAQQKKYPQQQYRQQPQQSCHISYLSTPDLLDVLEKEFTKTVYTIQNLKKENMFDSKRRKYICRVMIDNEHFLHQFNNSMANQSQRRSHDSEELQRLQDKITDLEKRNKQLNEEKNHIDSLLKSSFRQPSARDSNQVRSVSGGYTDKTDRNSKGTSESIKELQQQLSVCLRDLEEEREARVKAVSYNDYLEQQLEKEKEVKNDLQIRLSKIAGDKLVRDNPSITDLSDPNRPTKIGEMYSEIYDNEWTDAFEALINAGYGEEESIETLRLTLLNVIQFCSRKSESLLKKTEEAVNILFEEYKTAEHQVTKKKGPGHLTMPRNLSDQWGKLVLRSSFPDDLEAIALQDKWKPKIDENRGQKLDETVIKTDKSETAVVDQLKKFRKEVAESMVPIVEKAYMSASWNGSCIYALKPFIRKCILLGWMMVVQSPPMALAECKAHEKFAKEIYKEYTKSGNKIAYVVWPALLLREGGPVVGKGVAQAMKA